MTLFDFGTPEDILVEQNQTMVTHLMKVGQNTGHVSATGHMVVV